MNNKKGFTLIELMIVVAILGIIAMIAIPAYIGQQTRATRTEAFKNLEALRLFEEQVFAETATYAASAGNAGNTHAIRIANTTAIQGALPGFQPGNYYEYSYMIVQNQDIAGDAQTPCFRAIATGVAGTRVAGDQFNVDCNNNRDF